MSYSQWAASLHIPHLQASAAAAAASGTVQPASASLSLQYECSCGRLHPHLAFLYWCRHCQAMQCASCTTQQVDTYFCPACLNSVFTTPAFANQNRCEQCVECPCCNHILSSVQLRTGMYAYACEYCKWSSDEYVPHAAHVCGSGSGGGDAHPLITSESNLLSARVKEAENNGPAVATFAYLVAHYKARYKASVAAGAAAAGSAAAAGMLGFSGASSLGRAHKPQLFEEFESLLAASDAANPLTGGASLGVSSRVASLSISASSASAHADAAQGGGGDSSSALSLESSNVSRWMSWRAQREELLHRQHYTLPPEPVHNNFDPVPHALLGYFNEEGAEKPHDIDDISTLQQRLSHPSGQHFLTHSLLPRRKALSTKLAQRCSHCHKHLVKPGPGASKPSFEIHMPAVSFIPAVTIAQFPPLSVGEETDIILYFKNPVEKGMKLWLSLPDDAESVAARTALAAASSTPLAPMRAASASVRFHRASTVLAAYDDLPEENAVWQDGQQQAPETEPELVVFRHLSKVGLLLHITPRTHEQSTHFILLVNMQMEAIDGASSAAAPAPASPVVTFPLHVNLGFAMPAQ